MITERHERAPLSHVDAAWLRMDSATNAMMITALLGFDRPLDREALRARVVSRLLVHERFRHRVVEPVLGRPSWEADPHFDLDNHLHRVALPRPGTDAELAELVSDLASTPLDRGRPLWQLHLVEGVGEGSALVVRLHHALADGVALIQLLLGLAPPHASHALDAIHQGFAEALTLGKILLLPADPPTIFKGALGARKRVAWSHGVPLETVKRVARASSGTVNDVLAGAVSGALRRYLRRHHALGDEHDVRALVPVYVLGDHDGGALGNHFGLVFLSLPMGTEDPLQRVREAKQRMDAIKASPEAVVALGVLAALGLGSVEIERLAIDVFTRKATVMMTNVPGPPAPISLAGQPLRSIAVWAPTSGHLGLGLSLLSYGGEVRLGVLADAGLVPDPAAIAAGFEHEIGILCTEIGEGEFRS